MQFFWLKNFYQPLEEGDIEEFKMVIIDRGDPAGGDCNGHYRDENNELFDFGNRFCEGPVDNGALSRIVDSLDRICFFALKGQVDCDYVFAELGQFLSISYEVLNAIHCGNGPEKLLSLFKNIERFYGKYKNNTEIPVRTIGYAE